MRCSSLAVPSVTSVSAWVWPRVKSPEPCVRGVTPTSVAIGADLVGRATVGPALLDRDLLAHDLLVDRVGRAARVAARERVEPAVDARREGQLQLRLDARVERGALGRLELLGVLLGVGQLTQRVAELRLDGRLDGRVAALLADRRDRRAHLHAAHHVGLGRVAGDAGELGRRWPRPRPARCRRGRARPAARRSATRSGTRSRTARRRPATWAGRPWRAGRAAPGRAS